MMQTNSWQQSTHTKSIYILINISAIIDAKGIKADPPKSYAIQQLKRPGNQCKIRALLGMANYYGNLSLIKSANVMIQNKH